MGYVPCVLPLAMAVLLAAPPGTAPRGNTVLDPDDHKMSFSAAAVARFGALLGGGSEFVQPYGFGFAAQLHFHLVRMGGAPAHFGFAFHGGHTRFVETNGFLQGGTEDDALELNRTTVLSHTDLTLGPSFQVIGGPLVFLVSGGPGVGIDQLVRPVSADPKQDQQATSADFMVRGGAGIGIPIRNNHGLVIGAAVQQFFSGTRLPPDPLAADAEDTQTVVFDLVFESYLGYQAWF